MTTSNTPLDLNEAARELLDAARNSGSGRAATTLASGAGAPLSQTLLALTAGAVLAEHTAPGPATLQIIVGKALLVADGESAPMMVGEWMALPTSEHSLEAMEDFVALLTVAPSNAASAPSEG